MLSMRSRGHYGAETNVAHLAPSKVAKVYRQLCATPGQEVVQQTLQVNKNGKF